MFISTWIVWLVVVVLLVYGRRLWVLNRRHRTLELWVARDLIRLDDRLRAQEKEEQEEEADEWGEMDLAAEEALMDELYDADD